MPALLLAIGIGLISGVLSGAFGIGGGIVTTPAIRLLMHAPALIAVGTPLPVIIPSAITGAASYVRKGLAHPRAGIVLGVSGAVTSVLGAMAASKVGGPVVLVGTAVLILYAGGDMLMQVFKPPVAQVARAVDSATAAGASPARASIELPTFKLVVIGVIAGFYSGFFGLGGGFIVVPMLTRWVRMPLKAAIGTSLVTVAVLAVPGTITHALLGNIDWSIAAGLALGVVPGAAIGARITLGAKDRAIRIGFATLLLAVAAWLAISEAPGVFAR
ncbi:MAG TPA: sulfite exporter TauE/SafE family protein [Coriobacteriia bacterium]|nr:sulfite exporter TauE/SafE family protein [Coriobacteriia bacterium]